MAKNMAKIDNGTVINIEWCADNMGETDILKDIEDRPVRIGDSYSNGQFYRDGNVIMSTTEMLADAEAALAILMGGNI